jgi:hypothetical protein
MWFTGVLQSSYAEGGPTTKKRKTGFLLGKVMATFQMKG